MPDVVQPLTIDLIRQRLADCDAIDRDSAEGFYDSTKVNTFGYNAANEYEQALAMLDRAECTTRPASNGDYVQTPYEKGYAAAQAAIRKAIFG